MLLQGVTNCYQMLYTLFDIFWNLEIGNTNSGYGVLVKSCKILFSSISDENNYDHASKNQ